MAVGFCSVVEWLFCVAMERSTRHSPDVRSIAEAGPQSRPRIRAPLRGRRALTPASEPRLTIPNIRGMSSREAWLLEPDAMHTMEASLG